MVKIKVSTVDEYIAAAPEAARPILEELRALLRSVAPDAREAIKWGNPVLQGKRILFSYSAYKNHINFMPTGQSIKPFMEELQEYKLGQDTIQLPYDKPLQVDLLRRIAEHRVADVRENDALWMY